MKQAFQEYWRFICLNLIYQNEIITGQTIPWDKMEEM